MFPLRKELTERFWLYAHLKYTTGSCIIQSLAYLTQAHEQESKNIDYSVHSYTQKESYA